MNRALPDPVRRRLWLGALALPLAGCVVTPYGAYYRPSSAHAGARERRAWCQGQAGPVNGIELDLGGGVQLRASTERPTAPGLPLRVEVGVPAHTALRFTEPAVAVVQGSAASVPLRATAMRTLAVNPLEWIDPAALRPGTAAVADEPHGTLLVRTQPLRIPPPRRITVQGLSVLAEGRAATVLPPATMERVASRAQPYAYRSAQEEAALQARAAACRRDTPRLACQNIVDFAGASHSERLPQLRWDWRWWEAPWPAGSTVDGELRLAVLQAGRWRLDASGLQLADADGGAAQPLRLAAGTLTFSDSVDLQRGLASAQVQTRLLLEAELPAGVEAFELLLPAMLRNDTRIAPAAIRFDRRSFDGGVEPFNC